VSSTKENPLYGMIRSDLPIGSNLLHIVTFSFSEHVSEEQQESLMVECRELFDNCGGQAVETIANSCGGQY